MMLTEGEVLVVLIPVRRSNPHRAVRARQGAAAMLSRITRLMAAAILGVAVLGCTTASTPPPSGSPRASATEAAGSPTASTTPTGSPAVTGVPFDPAAALDTTFVSKIFTPAFRVKLPAYWIAIERDAIGFQIYFGDEDYEITIDSTYKQVETAEAAMARLLGAPSLTTQGDPQPITIGGRAGLTVVVDASAPVLWHDSGYHINVANLRVRLATVPVEGGETVSIFIVANTNASQFAAVDEIALRILSTLTWVPTK
jgi:hypothetical protein